MSIKYERAINQVRHKEAVRKQPTVLHYLGVGTD